MNLEVNPALIPLPESPKIEPVSDPQEDPVPIERSKENIELVPEKHSDKEPKEDEVKFYTNDLIDNLYKNVKEHWHKYKAWKAYGGYPEDFDKNFLIEEIRIIHTYGETYNLFSHHLRSEVLNYIEKTKRKVYCNDYERMHNEIADEIDKYFIKEKGQVILPEGFTIVESAPPENYEESEDDDDSSTVAEDQKFPDNDDDFYNKAKEIHESI